MSNLIPAFNNHFSEFIDDISNLFPDNVDILTAKNGLSTIRKANPKLLVKIWFTYVYEPYKSQIDSGDINFFITKDYSSDLSNLNKTDNIAKIMASIDRLRQPIKEMSAENQAKSMKYIQNLSKISVLSMMNS